MSKEKAPKDKAPAKTDGDKAAEGAEDAPKKKKGGLVKKLLIFGLPALLLIGGGAGAYFFFFAGGEPPAGPDGKHEIAEAPPVFMDLPDMLVNLTAAGGERAVLKLVVALELPDQKTETAIQPVMPRVIDNFQVFLRELRVEDLSGSAGMFRLKEELVRRVNLAVSPSQVKDVLFKEMLIQ